MKVAGLNVETILEKLFEAVLGDEKLSDKDAEKLLIGLYEGYANNAGPIVRAAPKVAGRVSKDLAPIIAGVLELITSTMDSTEVRGALDRFMKVRAKSRMASVDIYVKAGFTRQEAVSILLQDIAKAPSPSSIKTDTSK